MEKFHYKGRDKIGNITEGDIEAKDQQEAFAKLKQLNIIPIVVILPGSGLYKLQEFWKYLNKTKATLTDLIMFARQMFALLRAGVPIIRAIRLVGDNSHSTELKDSLYDISLSLESGKSLAASMAKYHKIYPELLQALVSIGENTGSLDAVFSQIAIHLEREEETIKRVKSATRYPIMVILTIVVAVIVINVFVIPAFANFFSRFGAELPLPTKILIASSNITVNYWHSILAGIGVIAFAVISYLKTDIGKMKWDRRKIKLPIIGRILFMAIMARFSRSFALTARSGLPLLESIKIISKVADNDYVAEKILSIRESIESGESMSVAAAHTKIFSSLVLQMMSIGEETGDLDRLLDEVGEFYETELDYGLKKLSSSIEPILISIVAVMVLILALGVFLPMWDISQVAIGS